MNYKLFLSKTIKISGLGLLVFFVYNALIDPYEISPLRIPIARINAMKPATDNFGRVHKSYQPLYLNSQTLILGNSRVDRGFRPEDTGDSKVFNGSYPGAVPGELILNIKTAHALNPQLKRILIGVDLMMFNHLRRPSQVEYTISGKNPLSIYLDAVSKFLKMSLSWDTAVQSYKTVVYNLNNTNVVFYSRQGHFSFFDYTPFNEVDRVSDQLLTTYASETDVFKNYKISQQNLEQLQNIIAFCKDTSIELKIFITPTHPVMQELLLQLGLWPVWEEWKRELVKMAPIYDFSTYNEFTTEPLGQDMKYYYEVAHFKPALGAILLRDLLKPEGSHDIVTVQNVDEKLRAHQQQHLQWQKDNPKMSERVHLVLEKLKK